MKRIYIAAALAILTLAVCFSARLLTKYETQYIIESVQDIDKAIESGDHDHALEQSMELRASWESIHDKLCIVLQHDHLDTLENIFAVLPHYIEKEEYILAGAECKRAITMTEHLDRAERLTFENIL